MKCDLKNNKGFSLVEILTALTIGAVILLGVTAFMNGSSVTYRTVTTQVALQDNVQETLNYLSDLLQRSMDVVFDEDDGVLYIFMPTKDTQDQAYEIYYVIYDSTRKNIHVHNVPVGIGDYSDELMLTPSEKNSLLKRNNMLASETYNFKVHVERDPISDEPSLVHVNVAFVKNTKTREATISIRPRNRSWTYDPTMPRFTTIITPSI